MAESLVALVAVDARGIGRNGYDTLCFLVLLTVLKMSTWVADLVLG